MQKIRSFDDKRLPNAFGRTQSIALVRWKLRHRKDSPLATERKNRTGKTVRGFSCFARRRRSVSSSRETPSLTATETSHEAAQTNQGVRESYVVYRSPRAGDFVAQTLCVLDEKHDFLAAVPGESDLTRASDAPKKQQSS